MKGKCRSAGRALAAGWVAFLILSVSAATAQSSGVYRDVPRGHWAYEAIRRASEAGVLQGIDGNFHGDKTITRYQMALITSKILEHVSGGGDSAQNLTEQDLQNLEALTIEFADELALLNVKVSTLEDSFAELRYDVEAIKTGGNFGGMPHAPWTPESGMHGLVALRLVNTGANGPTGAVGAPVGTAAGTYLPLTRYAGDVGLNGATGVYNSKLFFTIPQLSLSWTRDVDEGIGAHIQLDIDADIGDNISTATPAGTVVTTANLPAGDLNFQINEAYIDINDFFYGIGARMGAFALPISREHNGSHRSLDYTITPSAINTRLESYRPIGVEFRNEDDFIRWDWRLGVLSGLDGPGGAVDSILIPPLITTPFPGFAIPWTDTPQGVRSFGAGNEATGFGVFARVADQPNEGFGWDINYIANGGNISPDAGNAGTASEFTVIAGSVTYYWPYFDIIVQGFQGTSSNTTTQGPVPNPNADAVSSLGFFGLFNYRFNPDNSITLRVESNTDDVSSIGKVETTALTVGYNRIISDHSLFQFEYIAPTAKITAVAGNPLGAVSNDTDQDDTLIQANYKLRF